MAQYPLVLYTLLCDFARPAHAGTDTDSDDDVVEQEDLTSGQHNNCLHVRFLRYALHERQLWQIVDWLSTCSMLSLDKGWNWSKAFSGTLRKCSKDYK